MDTAEPLDAAEIAIHWAQSSEELRGALHVREQVFIREQGVPRAEELDGRDQQARHIVALEPGSDRVIGTLRLLIDAHIAKIGRVAVERDWRRRGIAARMLALALEGAHEQACTHVRLAAQIAATGVYRSAGFSVESEPFQESGIEHVWMGLQLPV
ncbi:MAG TPA: GNAT family N-acetyltransferase [Solirubrobacteraceae bacterium]|nr:GNAT family N-acetyltransferase [Solirubrobacteraceae bacterium]